MIARFSRVLSEGLVARQGDCLGMQARARFVCLSLDPEEEIP